MAEKLPQEIEVWHIIPAIRKEFAKVFKSDFNRSQKESAGLLGITEAAVSQYIKDKRACEIKFEKKIKDEIKISAEKIITKKTNTLQEIYRISNLVGVKKVLCKMHKAQANLKDCNICFGG